MSVSTSTVIERLQEEVEGLRRELDVARAGQTDAVKGKAALAAELVAVKSALATAKTERDAAHALAQRRDRRVKVLEEELVRAREETERCLVDRNILAKSLDELRFVMEEKLNVLHDDIVALNVNSDPLADLTRHASRIEKLYEAKLETALNALELLINATKDHGIATEQVLIECEGVLKTNEYNRAKRCCTSE